MGCLVGTTISGDPSEIIMGAFWSRMHECFRLRRQRQRKRERKQASSSPHPFPWDLPIPKGDKPHKINNNNDKKEKCVQQESCPVFCLCMCLCCVGVYVQGTGKVSQIHARHSPRCLWPLRGGQAKGTATHPPAWTAQSLIRRAPCIRAGSGYAQCPGILL